MSSIRATDALDLHLHTQASDGGWTVETLLQSLAERTFRIVAICDHDTMAAVPEAIERGAKLGILVVPGVEVTARWAERQWHVLVYGIDPFSPRGRELRAILDELADRMWAEAVSAIVALERKGYRLRSLKEVVAGRPLRPHHVLLTLIREGYATNLSTAHELTKRMGEAMAVDVPLERLLNVVRRAGGISVLAHPGRDDATQALDPALLPQLVAMGLEGLEVYYRSHSPEQTAQFLELTKQYGLVASAGSDSHAPGLPVDPIPYPASWISLLLQRLGIPLESLEEVSLSEVLGCPAASGEGTTRTKREHHLAMGVNLQELYQRGPNRE